MLYRFNLRQKNNWRQAIRRVSEHQKANNLATFDTDTSLVVFNEVNNRALITLKRPEKMNALNFEMVNTIKQKIKNWRGQVEMIIIRGNDRAFAVGGDIVSFYTDLREGYNYVKSAYSLYHLISTLDIPYVAIVPGIAIGTGVGLAVHGSAQIATETTRMAMPETQLGFVTDAGMTYVFSRMPGGLGMYLALTGHTLRGVDCVKIGLASHFVKNSNLAQLTTALLDGTITAKNFQHDLTNYTLNTASEKFSLDCFRPYIDGIFTLPRLEDMVAELEKQGTDWSVKTLDTLHKMSPTSLKITVRMLQDAKRKTLKECLQRELQMSRVLTHSSHSREFSEGIHAKLFRKDAQPKWNPGTIAEVTDEIIDEIFNMQLPSSEENAFE